MIVDEVRFVSSISCNYDGHKLYYGILGSSIMEKWYYINEANEAFEMKDSVCVKTKSLRVTGSEAGSIRNKHFYKKKIDRIMILDKKSHHVIIVRKFN